MPTPLKTVKFGSRKLITPNLFASYRLGDVTSAGVHFFPWKITNTQAVLVNAYDLIENPKCKAYRSKLEQAGISIREHIGFNGPIIIDSGAYYFIRNGNVQIDPVRVLEIELESGADIGVVLDHPFPPRAEDKQKRINLTIKNTTKMFQRYRDVSNSGMVLMPAVHGHDAGTLRSMMRRIQYVADKYNGGKLDQIGIGSLAPLAQNGNKETAVEILTTVRGLLPDSYIHCFSMGSALLMLLAFYCGVDTVDSQTWIMSAAFKYVQLPGHYVVRLASRERAANPYQYKKRVDRTREQIHKLYCEEGFVVKDWTTGEILKEPNEEDLKQYIDGLTDRQGNQHVHNRACHNLWVFNFEVKRAREEMRRGRFEEFVDSRLQDTKYYRAFLHAKAISRRN